MNGTFHHVHILSVFLLVQVRRFEGDNGIWALQHVAEIRCVFRSSHLDSHQYRYVFPWRCVKTFVCADLHNSGDNKPHFIPGMMGPFLGVTLVPQTEVRNIMIPIFHDMMDWEQRKNGNFKQVTVKSHAIKCKSNAVFMFNVKKHLMLNVLDV